MGTLLLALGLLLCLEGLIFALAPGRVEDLLAALREMPMEARRLVGLLALVSGLALIAVSYVIGG